MLWFGPIIVLSLQTRKVRLREIIELINARAGMPTQADWLQSVLLDLTLVASLKSPGSDLMSPYTAIHFLSMLQPLTNPTIIPCVP